MKVSDVMEDIRNIQKSWMTMTVCIDTYGDDLGILNFLRNRHVLETLDF